MTDLTGLIARRWPLALVGLAVALGGTVETYSHVGPTYAYTSSVLLLPPTVDTKPLAGAVDYTRGNPLFYLGSLMQARDILIGTLNSRDAQAALAQEYPGATNQIAQDVLNSSPLVVISGKSASKNEASGLVQHIVKEVPLTLRNLQTGIGVTNSSMITSQVLTQDALPTVSHKSQLRSAIMAGGGLSVGTFLFLALIDAILPSRGRLRRRGESSNQEITSAPSDLGETIAGRRIQRAPVPIRSATREEDRGEVNMEEDVLPRLSVTHRR